MEALPEDKRDWKPGETARSALDQLQEIANFPRFIEPLVADGTMPDFTDEQGLHQQYESYTACREVALERNTELCKAISAFPDDRMEDEVTLPFLGGLVMTMADVIGLQYWNLTYHQGQINYIQTMLGDLEMH